MITHPWRSDTAALRRVRKASGGLLLALAGLTGGALAQSVPGDSRPRETTIRMLFRDKPPYSYLESGVAKGFLLDRTREILAAAGVPAVFEQMPPKRLFAEIEANRAAVCSFGWYKIPAREVFAKFSLPIHQDRPHRILAHRAAVPRLTAAGTLRQAATDAGLALAVADGVSYGPDLDALIAGFAGRVDRALVPPLQVAQKVAAGRADFMLIDHEDLDHLQATTPEFASLGLQTVDMPDMPPGLKRYLLCSHQVSDAVLARIDAVIARLPPAAGQR